MAWSKVCARAIRAGMPLDAGVGWRTHNIDGGALAELEVVLCDALVRRGAVGPAVVVVQGSHRRPHLVQTRRQESTRPRTTRFAQLCCGRE